MFLENGEQETMLYRDFDVADRNLRRRLLEWAPTVHTGYWQGVPIQLKPEAAMKELLHTSFQVDLRGITDLDYWRKNIRPNLPWADEHFEKERWSGEPINPGETWRTWPWGLSADKHRTEGEQFNHTYAERYWPKFAGDTEGGHLDGVVRIPRKGIRYDYADINDLVAQLIRDPLTRQAYLPVWFPEDGSHNDRKPCTLGYHFIRRDDRLHVTYYIRSCDFVRHFRDDCYLTVRLLLALLEKLKDTSPRLWGTEVQPGLYTMHIVSLHCFVGDTYLLQKYERTDA